MGKRCGMRVVRRVVVLLLIVAAAAPPVIDAQRPTGARETPPGDRFNVTTPDGTVLAGEIRVPASAGPHPAILLAHGFGQDRRSLARLAVMFTAQGFVTVTYDARGFGESGGLVSLDGPKEVGDVRTLIAALAQRAEVLQDAPDDPRVGLYGTSYGGAVVLLAAAQDPRVDAVVVQSGWNELYDALFPDGVLNRDAVALLFSYGVRAASAKGQGIDPELIDLYNRTIAGTLRPEDARPYLAPRSPATVLATVRSPVLLLHGRADGLFPPLQAGANYRALRDAGVPVKLLVGPGGHGRGSATSNSTIAADGFVAAWWAHWLGGEGDRDALLADPVLAWDTTTGGFRPSTLEAATAAPFIQGPAPAPRAPDGPQAVLGLAALALLGFALAHRRR